MMIDNSFIFIRAVCLVVTVVFLVNCRMKSIGGSYEGYVTVKLDGSLVSTDTFSTIINTKLRSARFVLRGDNEQLLANVELKHTRTGNLRLKTDITGTATSYLLEYDKTCAFSKKKTERKKNFQVDACLQGNVVNVSMKGTKANGEKSEIVIYASKKEVDGSYGPEIEPGIYSLEDLIERAKAFNFSILQDGQRVFRAQQEMLQARLRLLPSLNTGTLLSAIEGQYGAGLITEVGTLLPFLFPSNWFRFSENDSFYKAEQESFRALNYNQIEIVESLYYLYMKDSAHYQYLEEMISLLDYLEKAYEYRSQSNPQPSSFLKVIEGERSVYKDDQLALKNYMVKQKSSLIQATGSSFTGSQKVSFRTMKAPVLNDQFRMKVSHLIADALDKSPEIRATFYLEEAVRNRRSAAMWKWLDPDSDSIYNLGPSWGKNIKIERSNINQLRTQRAELEDTIKSDLRMLEVGLNNAVDRYMLVKGAQKNNLDVFYEEVNRYMDGSDVAILDLISYAKSASESGMRRISMSFRYLTMKAKLNRLLFDGFYSSWQ